MFINTEQNIKSSLNNKNIKYLQIAIPGSAYPKSCKSRDFIKKFPCAYLIYVKQRYHINTHRNNWLIKRYYIRSNQLGED